MSHLLRSYGNPLSYFCVPSHLTDSTHKIAERNFQIFLLCSCLYSCMYKSDQNFEIVHVSFEKIDTEESISSLSEVSSLDNDLDSMHLECGSFAKEMFDDEMDSNSWNEIKSESYAEFMEDRNLVEEVTSLVEDNTIDPVDCYQHFITDEIIDLMVRGIIIQVELVQMSKLSHYWSSSQLYGSEIIRNSMSRERGLNCFSSFGIFRTTITKIRTKTGCSSWNRSWIY